MSNTDAPGFGTQAVNPATNCETGSTSRNLRTPASGTLNTEANSMKGKKESAKQQAAELTEDAKQQVYEATEQVKQTGKQYLQDKKQMLGQEIGVFCDAIRSAADTLRDHDHQSVACYANAAAEQLDRLRDTVENRSSKRLADDARCLVHQRPEVVYGSLFIAGLAAVRFLKASTPRRGRAGGQAIRDNREFGRAREESRLQGETPFSTGYSRPNAPSSTTPPLTAASTKPLTASTKTSTKPETSPVNYEVKK